MDQSYWKEQLQKYRARTLTEEEESALWLAMADPEAAGEWKEIIATFFQEQRTSAEYEPETWEPTLQAVFESDRPTRRTAIHRIHILRRWSAAAAIIIALIGGIYLWNIGIHKKAVPVSPTPMVKNDVLPGGNKAVLTLAGGQRIILDSAHAGQLTIQGNAQVMKINGGKLAYQSTGNTTGTAVVYNTLTTPRGGQYQLTLPDGSQVWLNAASSITYPTTFSETVRKVTITGEAYLEVAQKASQPFAVTVNNITIDVIGTSFNINSYPDEPSLKTTVLTGKVRVVQAGRQVILMPGEQAIAAGNLTVSPVPNIDQVTAWKNGSFAFTNADLPTVMRQLARWYNVDVKYEGVMPQRRFNGRIGRSLTLDQVLQGLAKSGVHYSIEAGNKLIIRP